LIGPKTIDRTAERIDDAADQFRTDRDFEHTRGATDFIAFLELQIVAEDDGANVVFFEIEGEGRDLLAGFGRGDLKHFAGHRLHETVDAGDAVFDFEDGTDFLDIEFIEVGRFDFAKQDVLDFTGAERRRRSHWIGR
jgi:hypothetical protein